MSEIKELHEVCSAEEIEKLEGFKVTGICDGRTDENTDYITFEFIGPKGEKAVLVIDDAVLFYGNELDE